MKIPTESIESIPRPIELVEAFLTTQSPYVLDIIHNHIKLHQRIFVGVISPVNPRIEIAEEVRDSILEAAMYILIEQLDTTNDCGFYPFCNDTSTSHDIDFAKIEIRIRGPLLTSEIIAEGSRC